MTSTPPIPTRTRNFLAHFDGTRRNSTCLPASEMHSDLPVRTRLHYASVFINSSTAGFRNGGSGSSGLKPTPYRRRSRIPRAATVPRAFVRPLNCSSRAREPLLLRKCVTMRRAQVGQICLVLTGRIFAQHGERAIFAGLRQAQPYGFLVSLASSSAIACNSSDVSQRPCRRRPSCALRRASRSPSCR